MTLINEFPKILEASKKVFEDAKTIDFDVKQEINCQENVEPNVLALGDNIQFMRYLLLEKNFARKIKMIYIDPPFFSKANYDAVLHLTTKDGSKLPAVKHFAYEDIWQKDMTGYLTMLCQRLLLMKELLAENGTIWVHLDWHVVHYVKIFLDEIFGQDNFVNEIIWHYKSGGSGKRHFAKKHDTILVYSKSKKYYFAPPKEKSYNRGFKPYRFKGVKEYRDEMGWYTMVTMKDVWQVDMVGRTSSERTGYATQKPEALIQRVVESATEEGDICADFFCGSGTLGAVCEKSGRRWICCDQSRLAVTASMKRLHFLGASVKVLEEHKRTEETSENCRAEFDVTCQDVTGSDKSIINIELKNYFLKKLPESLDEVGKNTISSVLKENPLSLVDYWSVDFDFDGKIFKPDVFLARDRGKVIPVNCEKLCPKNKIRRICIRIVDVLGNETFSYI